MEASFLKKIKLYGDGKRINIMLMEYFTGRAHDLLFPGDDERLGDVIKRMNDAIKDTGDKTPYDQNCENLFLSMTFKGIDLHWYEKKSKEHILGGQPSGLDFGSCCTFVGELNIDASHENQSLIEKFHKTDFKAKHGEENGVKILFDIEQWNYHYINGHASGLMVSLSDPRSKPMMEFSSQSLKSGTDVKITIKPTITYTTEDAISKFDPIDRKCYVEGENTLDRVPYDEGFTYDMTNCLIDQGIMNIYWTCRCRPSFAPDDNEYAK